MARASVELGASGFSQRTRLPAAASSMTISRCKWFATTTLTTLMSSVLTMASQLVSWRSKP
jgi:hypothetical protein